MADPRDPKAPKPAPDPAAPEALPFAGEEGAWQDDLAAWDASLPIEAPPAPAAQAIQPTPNGPAPGAAPEEENPFADTPTTVVSAIPVGLDVEDLSDAVEELPDAAA